MLSLLYLVKVTTKFILFSLPVTRDTAVSSYVKDLAIIIKFNYSVSIELK